MPESSSFPSNTTPSPLRDGVDERVARAIVAAHRARLNWLLRVPEWMPFYERGVVALALPGRRQGIAWEAALEALLLEQKHQLVRWVVGRFNQHLSREVAQLMCRVVGLERFSEIDLDSVLTLRQWGRLREALIFRLSREHARYKHAQQLLFVAHHGLVDAVVGRIVFAETHRADCAQEGRVALLHAIDRADTEGDFQAYAGCWIRRAVRNHLVRQRLPVHAPINLVVQALSTPETGGSPEEPGTSPGDERLRILVLEMLRHPAVSLDQPDEDDRPAFANTLADPSAELPSDAADRADLQGWLAHGLDDLTAKQREVLELRFGLRGTGPHTLSEIARGAGISHQQVSMRAKRALERLERALGRVVSECDASAGR